MAEELFIELLFLSLVIDVLILDSFNIGGDQMVSVKGWVNVVDLDYFLYLLVLESRGFLTVLLLWQLVDCQVVGDQEGGCL